MGGGGGGIDDMTSTSKYDTRAWPGTTLNVSTNPDPYKTKLGWEYQLYGEMVHHYMKVKVTGDDAEFTAIRSTDGSILFQRTIHRHFP